MKRDPADLALIRRQFAEGLRLGKSLAAGYYRKRDAHDCGRPRCGICHPEKRFGHTPTRQELAAELRLREQAAE